MFSRGRVLITFLDIRTLFFVLAIISTALTIDLFVYWLHYRNIKGITCWLLAMILIMTGTTLFAVTDLVPPFFSTVLANTLCISGYTLMLQGIKVFYEEKGITYEWIIIPATFLLWVYFTHVDDNLEIRIIIFSVILAYLMYRGSYLLFKRHREETIRSLTFASVSTLLLALFFTLRAILTLMHIGPPSSRSFFTPNILTVITLIALNTTNISLVLGLLSLPGQRSRARLKETSEELKMQNQELAYSETKFKSLSDASFEGIIFTKENILLEHNSAIFDMFGYDTDEILTGRSVIEFVAPEARHEVIQKIKSEYTQAYETCTIKKDGTVFPVEIRGRMFEYHGSIIRVSAIRDITEQKKLTRELHNLARTDALTGAYNRRALMEIFDFEYAKSRRYNHHFALLMIDIDFFKKINDEYGHDIGDYVLKRLVSESENQMREADCFARWGGEEFLALLPETELNEAAQVAERLRERISQIVINKDNSRIQITVSIGLTEVTDYESNFDDILKKADTALYSAKAGGRNQVCVL